MKFSTGFFCALVPKKLFKNDFRNLLCKWSCLCLATARPDFSGNGTNPHESFSLIIAAQAAIMNKSLLIRAIRALVARADAEGIKMRTECGYVTDFDVT